MTLKTTSQIKEAESDRILTDAVSVVEILCQENSKIGIFQMVFFTAEHFREQC